MRLRLMFLALLGVLLTAPVQAESPPLPQVDFQGDWQLQDGSGDMIQSMTMRYSVEEPVMAIFVSAEGMEMNAIRRMESGEMIMWTSAMPGMAMRMTIPQEELTADATNTGRREEVNGEACTIWTANDAEVCVSDDGIPLESRFDGGVAQLVNIDRAPQDGASFGPPEGVQVMDLPANMLGENMPMPGEGFGLPF
ncbi:MAG: hypothetical protein AAFX39_05875 [Pseudomonadota bacterium]